MLAAISSSLHSEADVVRTYTPLSSFKNNKLVLVLLLFFYFIITMINERKISLVELVTITIQKFNILLL